MKYLDNPYIRHSNIQESFLILSHLSIVPVRDDLYFKGIAAGAFNFSFFLLMPCFVLTHGGTLG